MYELPIAALEAPICFGKGLVVSSFVISGRELRYGTESVSLLLGYSRNYLTRQLSRDTKKCGKKLRALFGMGFTGYQIRVKAPRPAGGATFANTIGFDDLSIWVEYEAVKVSNPRAIALLTSAFREVLLDRTYHAHGLPEIPLQQRQDNFALSFEEREALLAEDRQDVENLWLPGEDVDGECDRYFVNELLKWALMRGLYSEAPSLEL
jgi:hypothetical protein